MEDIRLAEGTRTLISHPLARAHRKNHRYAAGKGGRKWKHTCSVHLSGPLLHNINRTPRCNGSLFNEI
jgi:hypothetical protein